MSLGEGRRGLFIMLGVLLLFGGGLLIGGLDVVDRKNDRLWFVAQALNGPIAFAADYANRNLLDKFPTTDVNRDGKADVLRQPDWRSAYQEREPRVMGQLQHTSVGHINEVGTLYVALAGLMNLVAILDALQRPGSPRREPAAT